jgi:hypothetical protein
MGTPVVAMMPDMARANTATVQITFRIPNRFQTEAAELSKEMAAESGLDVSLTDVYRAALAKGFEVLRQEVERRRMVEMHLGEFDTVVFDVNREPKRVQEITDRATRLAASKGRTVSVIDDTGREVFRVAPPSPPPASAPAPKRPKR